MTLPVFASFSTSTWWPGVWPGAALMMAAPSPKTSYSSLSNGTHLLFSSAEKNRGSTRSLFGFHMNSRSARGVSHVAPANWFKLAVWSLCACEMAT
jgi:hypothetical protein